MGAITASSPTIDPSAPGDPIAVDAIFTKSLLLQRLRARAPEVAAGPLVRERQYWIGTPTPAERGAPPELAEARFAGFEREARPTTKPERQGLFTSTTCLGTLGMWSVYLELHRGSTLFSQPWRGQTVSIASHADVVELSSAAEWATLLARYSRRSDGLIYPDWSAIAQNRVGVHLSAGAIAAAQGFCFRFEGGVTAPLYWDVESTVWFRWVVRDSFQVA
jgi:hypothetical protein